MAKACVNDCTSKPSHWAYDGPHRVAVHTDAAAEHFREQGWRVRTVEQDRLDRAGALLVLVVGVFERYDAAPGLRREIVALLEELVAADGKGR